MISLTNVTKNGLIVTFGCTIVFLILVQAWDAISPVSCN
jgi:hypothetical protein